MARTGIFIGGFTLLTGALLLAGWKLGILRSIGTFWTAIAVLVLLGIGIMLGVSKSGGRIAIDQ